MLARATGFLRRAKPVASPVLTQAKRTIVSEGHYIYRPTDGEEIPVSLPDPKKIIEEVKGYMHSESELRVMLYAKNSWKKHMIDAGIDQYEAQSNCPIAYTYDEKDVESLLSGLNIIDIQQDHIFPYKVSQYVKYKYEKEPWFDAMPETVFRALERRLGWHLMIRARLNGKRP